MCDQGHLLSELAERASGLRYDSTEAKAILDTEDWANHWPVVDADGLLTGDVVETDGCAGYLNVRDEAMIAVEELRPGQRSSAIDGYADV